MQYTIKNLQLSFKNAYENVNKHKWITIIFVIILIFIVLISFKNNSIDLFTDPSTTSITTTNPITTSVTTIPKTTFIDINETDLLIPQPPVTTNAFTNFNFNFIKDYLNYKQLKNNNIDILNKKQEKIDNLNTRMGNILNQ